MQVTINFEKRHLIFLIILLIIFSVGLVIGQSNPNVPNPGHAAESVGPGKFAAGNFEFPEDLTVDENINAMKNVLFNSELTGIFWLADSRDTSKPHIEYSTSPTIKGLWISTGNTGTGGNVSVEGGNLVMESNRGIKLGTVTRYTWPFSQCIDYQSDWVYKRAGTAIATISCTADYPVALRGGCESGCAWISRNEIVDDIQYCHITTDIGTFCSVGNSQRSVRARITCCKA